MVYLIDKDALIAEIENLENRYKTCLTRNSYEEGLKDGRLIGYKDTLYKINTLEVKEVDLENSVKGRIDYPIIGYDFPNIYPNYKELKDYCDKNGIKDEDKVKIIIIKET